MDINKRGFKVTEAAGGQEANGVEGRRAIGAEDRLQRVGGEGQCDHGLFFQTESNNKQAI